MGHLPVVVTLGKVVNFAPSVAESVETGVFDLLGQIKVSVLETAVGSS